MDQPTYTNFDLVIEHTATGYRARVLDSPTGQSPWQPVTLPLSDAELAAAISATWAAPDSRAYRYGDEPSTPLDPKTFGQRLFDALFQQGILTVFNRSLAMVEQQGGGLRLRLHLNDAAALAALPWEYLYGPAPYGFFALSRQTPLVRYLDLPQTQRALRVEPPLHILAVIADPEDLAPRLDVEREWQLLQQELGVLQAEGLLTLERLVAPTIAALQRRLTQAPPIHVLHFIGHGRYDTHSRTGSLVLEDGHRRRQLLDADALGALLKDHHTLRLAFLNACEGGRGETDDPFTGLAQALVQHRLPAVIAMQYPISDRAAIHLAHAFYRALAGGLPVDAALAQARQALYVQRQRLEWGTPVLFLRAPDGRLFDVPARSDQPAPGAEPYQGLDYYDVADAPRFFGREALTAELVAYLRDHRFLAVIGASGSGKSSLVRAGLVPALQRGEPLIDGSQPPKGSEHWSVHIITPKAHPLEQLAATLTKASESVTAQATLMDDLAQNPRSLHLYVTRLLSHSPADRLLLVVDQFEELFTLCRDPQERQHFVDNLLTAATPEGATTVVITLRADFYHHCADFARLRRALELYQKYIGPMTADELRRAIEDPAHLGGWDIESGLVDLLLDDVGDEPGALPLLSHALLETWKRRRGRTLTLAGYAASGRVQGAIAKTAEDVLNRQLTAEERLIARTIFIRLTELGEGVQDTRRRVTLAELLPIGEGANAVERVLKELADARLITTDQDEVEVAHEALIREWATLREWLQEDREGLRIHRRLTEAAAEWSIHKAASFLYRGTRLTQLEEWAAAHAGDLNEQEQAFLKASKAEREYQVKEQQRIQHERNVEAKLAANRLRRRAIYLSAALVVALIAIIATYYFLVESRKFLVESRKNAMEATQNAIVAEARLAQFGGVVDGISLDQVLAIAQDLTQSGDRDGALVLIQRSLESNPEYLSKIRINELGNGKRSLLYAAIDVTLLNLTQKGDDVTAQKLREALNWEANGTTYIYIPGGEFLMGSDHLYGDESPQHTIVLNGYWIQQTEVTKVEYRHCMEEGPCTQPNDSRLDDQEYSNHPVVGVTWVQASNYATWVGGRLPTEAEWEKACRDADARIYPWGDEEPNEDLLNYNNHIGKTTAVGSYPPGAYALYDMAGNVWEWTADLYSQDYYANSPNQNPTGPTEGYERTLRGGSYQDTANGVRCADRAILDTFTDSLIILGFRVVIDSPPGF
jgi:formylglycine-generating enzyme required for sulfatase activity